MKKLSIVCLIILVAALPLCVAGFDGEEDLFTLDETAPSYSQLMLEIYVDETGKSLVLGYVDDLASLPFIQTAEYIYENETRQLYALTQSLTGKSEDRWTFTLSTTAVYTDYHVVIYLPREVQLGRITCSDGLEYLVSAANESFIVDLHGYVVVNPLVTIEYQQPLTTSAEEAGGSKLDHGYLILIVLLALVTVALLITVLRLQWRGGSRHADKTPVAKEALQPTPEMTRIMETLTDRERAIVTALLKHGGEMTQADLRYETEIPKSSLTGILRTLERRQIVRKKEWGRTNVIELSDWLLSQTERR